MASIVGDAAHGQTGGRARLWTQFAIHPAHRRKRPLRVRSSLYYPDRRTEDPGPSSEVRHYVLTCPVCGTSVDDDGVIQIHLEDIPARIADLYP
jgi:hypothetical protein